MVVLLLICALIALPPAAATLTTLCALAIATLLGCATLRLHRRAARTAHEVRQPLTTGLLALHAAARRGEVPPRVVASLELELRRAAYALADRQTAPDDVDLHDLLSAQARTWREVAAAHGSTLTLEPGPGTPVVHADTLRLAQATSNVLANAIEHGGGRITIRTLAIGDRIRIEVTDGGPGLPASIAELSRRPRGAHGHGLSIATSALRHTHGHLTPNPSGITIDLPAKATR